MTSPALSVVRRSEQLVDLLRGFVRRKDFNLIRARRESGEIEMQSAEKGSGVCLGRWFQTLFLHSRENEMVDASFGPGGVFHLGQFLGLKGLE